MVISYPERKEARVEVQMRMGVRGVVAPPYGTGYIIAHQTGPDKPDGLLTLLDVKNL